MRNLFDSDRSKSKQVIKILAIFIVICCTVLSCFSCFIITRIPRPTLFIEESISEIREPIHIPSMIFLGAVQCILLCVDNKTCKRASVLCSVAMLLIIIATTIRKKYECVFDSMGGLGHKELEKTPFWYAVLLFGIINLVVQIILRKKSLSMYERTEDSSMY